MSLQGPLCDGALGQVHIIYVAECTQHQQIKSVFNLRNNESTGPPGRMWLLERKRNAGHIQKHYKIMTSSFALRGIITVSTFWEDKVVTVND